MYDFERGAKKLTKKVRKGYEAATEKVGEVVEDTRERISEIDLGESMDNVRDLVRKHPGKAMLITAAAGFMLASVIGRARRRDS